MSARAKPVLRVSLEADGWRWTFRSENGAVQARSPKGYDRRGDCVSALRRVIRGLPLAEIEVGPGPARAPSAKRRSLAVGLGLPSRPRR